MRVNLSKSGVGLSSGVKGLRVSTGPRGTYLNAGRKGLYYRKKLSGNKLPQVTPPNNSLLWLAIIGGILVAGIIGFFVLAVVAAILKSA